MQNFVQQNLRVLCCHTKHSRKANHPARNLAFCNYRMIINDTTINRKLIDASLHASKHTRLSFSLFIEYYMSVDIFKRIRIAFLYRYECVSRFQIPIALVGLVRPHSDISRAFFAFTNTNTLPLDGDIKRRSFITDRVTREER